MIASVVLIIAASATSFTGTTTDLSGCLAHATTIEAVTTCQVTFGNTEQEDPVESAPVSTSQSEATAEYMWLPSCPSALPTVRDAASMSCIASESCQAPGEVRLSLWARQLTDAVGDLVKDGWSYLQSGCRDPASAGPVRQRRVLTTQDVISAIRRVGVPTSSVQGPQYTLVNLDTTFSTEPQHVERTLTIIGYTVDVEISPSSYRWEWGDGTSSTTSTPGRPYPATDVTHTYTRATDNGAGVSLSVGVTYTARYRVDGGSWQAIPEVLTIPGTPRALPVKQASAVLVADD